MSSSSSPPPPATENDEYMEAVDSGEASRPGQDVETAGTTAVVAGAAASQTVSSSHHQEAVGSVGAEVDLYMDELGDYDSDEHMDDDVGDVDLDEEEGGGKFSESAEVEATLEALWRKVVAMEEKPSAGHACSVCMEHITCEGAHRICCIPCGHVYGKSCLERWLRRDGNDETAKCPQCGALFGENAIIDLYAPGNLWDGCGHLQEVKVYVTKAIAEVVLQCERQLEDMGIQARSKIVKLKAEHISSIQKVQAQVMELEDLMDQIKKERLVQKQSLDAALEEVRTDVKLIQERMIGVGKLLPPPPKPAQLQEQNPPAQESRPRRIVKPNKRFYSNEWAR